MSAIPAGDTVPHAVFAALSDATRRGVLDAVAREGPLTATELATTLPVSRQAIAKHLAILRDAGLVESHHVGRETRFSAATQPLSEATRWLERTQQAWDLRLQRLSARAAGDER